MVWFSLYDALLRGNGAAAHLVVPASRPGIAVYTDLSY